MKVLRSKLESKLWVKITSWVVLPLFVLFGMHLLEYMNFQNWTDVFEMWGKHTGAYWFALIVTMTLSLVILLLVKKLWIFTTVYGILVLGLGVTNCMKLITNGDYFFPWDFLMAGKVGDLLGFADFSLPPFFYAAIPIVIVISVLLWLGNVGLPLKWYYRVSGALVVMIPFVVMFNTPAKTETLLSKFEMSYEDSILQSSNYRNNGFTNAFTINCLALKISAPDGYNKQNVTAYLSDYKETTEGTKTPDVVVVMSEAFYDIRELKGTTFSQNPLANYDEIISRDNAISGNMYTTAHGAGTVRTEFEVLTGLTVDYLINGTSPYIYITRDTEGYVSNYKAQGYRTTAIHTYDKTFYMRDDAYPLFGFDEFIARDTIKEIYETSYRRGYIKDDVFMDVVIDTLEKNTDTPNFIYGITMENHGKYEKSNPEDIVIDVQNDNLKQAQLDSVITYTQGVYNADLSLKKLIDYVDNRDKPTIVLFFGDHKPVLGGSQAAYNQAGNIDISDGYDTEEKKYVYSTQYLMYANYDVDYGVLEQSPDMSTYYMLTHLAKVTDTAMTPFMQYLYDSYLDLPYYNVRLGMELDKQGEDFINSMKLISYDRIKGKEYSVN